MSLKQKVIALFTILGIIVALTACSPKTSTNTNEGDQKGETGQKASNEPLWGGTMNVAFPTDAISFDPATVTDAVGWNLMRQLYDRLVDYEKDTNKLIPQAAKEMPTVSEDGKTYTFHLRENLKFWNGQPVTAEDFVYSLTRILDPKVQSPVMGFWTGIEGAKAFTKGKADSVSGIKAIDEHTLEITLESPNSAFMYVIAMPQGSVIPKGSADNDEFKTNPMGSGPFVFKNWKPGEEINVERNPNYWDSPKPYLDKIHYTLNVDPKVALLQLEKGDVDLLGGGIPQSQFLQVMNDPKLKPYLVKRDVQSTYFLTMNVQMKPFDNESVRKAVSLAVNRKQLLKLMNNQGEVAKGLIPPGVNGYTGDLPELEYNPEKAKELLAEAGYPKGFKTTLYSWNTDPWTALDAELVQELSDVGIEVEVKAISANAFFGIVSKPKTVPMALTFWIADFPDASDFLNVLVNCDNAVEGGQNYSYYCNQKMDSTVGKALEQTDQAQAENYFKQAEQMMMDDMPMAPLFHSNVTHLHGKKVKNYYAQPMWSWDMTNYWLERGSSKPPSN